MFRTPFCLFFGLLFGFCVYLFVVLSFGPITINYSDPKLVETTRIENIVRVMMHEKDNFTVFVLDDGKLKDSKLVFRVYPTGQGVFEPSDFSEIFVDVPENEMSWAEILRYQVDDSHLGYITFKLHLHSPQEINGAEWHRTIKEGKFEKTIKGQTTVVE